VKLDINAMKWTREPAEYKVDGDAVAITTAPGTDLWQRAYYHFRNDNAPVLQLETDERFFSFVVRTDFTRSAHRFDQCGVALYLDSENWLKASVEYENETFQHLGSVVTNHGYSDWATTAIPADVKQMWYRLSRREDDYCLECSPDGETFSQMRVCHLWEGAGDHPLRHLRLQPGGLQLYRHLHRHGRHRVRLEGPRRPEAGRGILIISVLVRNWGDKRSSLFVLAIRTPYSD